MAIQTTTLVANAVLHDISNDGRYVSYTSVSGGAESLWRLDRTTGVSLLADSEPFSDHGSATARGINDGALSADGRFIFYAKGDLTGSHSSSGGVAKLFVKDLQSGAPATEVAVGRSAQDISNDGQRLLYSISYSLSDTRYLVKNTSNGTATEIQTAPFSKDNAQLSPDGRYAVIETPPFFKVYDLQNGTSTQITGNTSFSGGGFSDNGRYVGYYVLEPSPTVVGHAYVRDLTNGSTVIASASATGVAGNGDSRFAALSGDGRHVAFYSDATNLIPGDTNGQSDLFVKDLNTGAIRRIESNVNNSEVLLSFDGSTVLRGGGSITATTFLPPAIAISLISLNDFVNAAEETAPIPVFGTSDAIGRTVVVTSPSGATASGVVQANGTWSVNVASSGVADGSRSFSAAVVDEFGVRGQASKAAIFDSVAPSLSIFDTYVNAAEKAAGVISINGDSDAIGRQVSVSVNGVLIGTPTVQAPTSGAFGAWSVSYNVAGLADGNYRIDFGVADAAGNRNDRNIFLTVDTRAPEIAIRSIGGDNVLNAAELAALAPVVGTSDAIGRTVTVSMSGKVLGTAVVQTNGTWTANVNLKGAAKDIVLTAAVADLAGNQGLATGSAFVDSDVIRVMTRADGSQANAGPGGFTDHGAPTVSADGRFVAFASAYAGLVPGDANSFYDIFIKDVGTGAIQRVSDGVGGAQSNGDSSAPIFSADGRFLAFQSKASNLVAGDTNGLPDTFVLEVATGVIERVSVNAAGNQVTGVTYDYLPDRPSISADGRYVAFNSLYLSGSGVIDTVVKDRQTGAIQVATKIAGDSFYEFIIHSISADGRYLAFASRAPAGPNDTNGTEDVFVRDFQTGALTLVSRTPAGMAADSGSYGPVISADGRYVAFVSNARDLFPGQPPLNATQAFLHDLQTGVTRLVSATADGQEMSSTNNLIAGNLSVSSNGRYVSFATYASGQDVYVKDMLTGALVELTRGVAGVIFGSDGDSGDVSADGRYAAFVSRASDLVGDDTNNASDIFLRRLASADTLTLAAVAGDDRVTAAEADAALAIGGTASRIGAPVTVYVDGKIAGTAVVGAGGAWTSTINTIALSPGVHSVRATALDNAGFGVSDGAILTVDAGAPPAIATYNGGLPAARALAGGFASTGSTVRLFDGGVQLGSALANASGLWEINFAALANGVHTLAATATPVGGSASALSASFKVIVTSQGQSILGGPGADTLIGGAGLDTADYSEKAASVVVFLNGAIAAAVTVGGAAEDTVRDIENIIGGTGADTLVGDGKANVLTGGGGGDFLFSNGFNPDGTMKTGAGSDTLNGGDANDGLFGGDGADALNGDDGDDGMVGGAGGDTLNGGVGSDFLFGGSFSPSGTFLANSGDDTLNGGDGDDGLYGQDGNDTINGDAGNDYVEGGAGNDTINGGAGSDFLLGQDGGDTINGGLGFDYMYGGLGADTFIFRNGDSADWVLDFSAAQGDKLRFLDFGFANFAAIPFVDLSTPGNPVVQLNVTSGGSTDQLTIFGVTLAQLNATNVLVA